MKTTLLSTTLMLIFILTGQTAKSQVENSLSYDGINDYLVVPNASSLITSGTGISLSAWVYPSNALANWPDFDGIAGMRNDFDADFYILQLTATQVEGRFRNSLGTEFTITENNLTIDTWQHYMLTYDGSTLKIYRNGTMTASAPASGTISNTATDLTIGGLTYQMTYFYLNGKVDEVSMWSRGLTSTEVNDVYWGNVNTADADLQVYYKFNQGVGGANNAGVTTLNDETGNLDGTLYNFALDGNFSNWIGEGPLTIDESAFCNSCIMDVHPNPTNGVLNVQDVSEPTHFVVTNYLGETVKHGILDVNNSTIDLSDADASVYFLSVGEKMLRIVKVE